MLDLEEAIKLGEQKGQGVDGGRPSFFIKAVDQKKPDGSVTSTNEIYVKIFNISDPKNIIERPKRKEDEARWPQHWQAYVDKTETPTEGTPIESFPELTPADVVNLKRAHILTLEDMIEMAESQLRNVLGAKAMATLKAAKQFLEYRGDVAPLLRRIEELEKQIGDLTSNVSERAEGDGVSGSADDSGEQQSGRKNNSGAGKKRRKKAGKRVSVDDSD